MGRYSKEAESAFQKFSKSDSAELTKDEYGALYNTGLIEKIYAGKTMWDSTMPASGLCWISEQGKDYRYELENKRSDIIFKWAGIAIGVLTLIFSIIAAVT